jgi:predicted metalloprotease
MRWKPGGSGDDVEDRRGMTAGRGVAGLGIGGLLLVGLLSAVTGTNFFDLLSQVSGPADPGSGVSQPAQSSPEEERLVQFVTFVLNDTQATWDKALQGRYEHARLVLFRGAVQSACGYAEAATGPFYCPGDRKVYIDLGFYEDLRRRFGAPGDFAQAYVLAHEIGHHVQNLLGLEARMREAQSAGVRGKNELSVRFELQADCFAGIWAHSTAERKLLEQGDVEEALGAAAAVGDDRIQKMATGQVHPESFTHGSAEQRASWFRRGFDSGSVAACDTFAAGS